MNHIRITVCAAITIVSCGIIQARSQEPFYIDAEYAHNRYVGNSVEDSIAYERICDSLSWAHFNLGFQKFQYIADTAVIRRTYRTFSDHNMQLYHLVEERWTEPLFKAIQHKIYRWKYHPEFPDHFTRDSTLHGDVGFEFDATWDVDQNLVNAVIFRVVGRLSCRCSYAHL